MLLHARCRRAYLLATDSKLEASKWYIRPYVLSHILWNRIDFKILEAYRLSHTLDRRSPTFDRLSHTLDRHAAH